MPANWPTSPTTGQSYSFEGKEWVWDGEKWTQSRVPVNKIQGLVNLFTSVPIAQPATSKTYV